MKFDDRRGKGWRVSIKRMGLPPGKVTPGPYYLGLDSLYQYCVYGKDDVPIGSFACWMDKNGDLTDMLTVINNAQLFVKALCENGGYENFWKSLPDGSAPAVTPGPYRLKAEKCYVFNVYGKGNTLIATFGSQYGMKPEGVLANAQLLIKALRANAKEKL